MTQKRFTAFTENDEETFVIRETPDPIENTTETSPPADGSVTWNGPDNQLLTLDQGDWFREVYGNAKFRVPDANQ